MFSQQQQNLTNLVFHSPKKKKKNFLGAFLLTPSHELSMERAALICEKMNFKGCFSLTKTATGILFKFSNPEDYQAVYRKGFHKVTGGRFYRKVNIQILFSCNISCIIKNEGEQDHY